MTPEQMLALLHLLADLRMQIARQAEELTVLREQVAESKPPRP